MPYRVKQGMEELMYRVYLTDTLKGLAGGSERYYDLINATAAPEETRTADEIKAEVGAVFNGRGA